jgi:hypothetical protein
MRRIVVSEFVSLDGVVEDPGWTFRFGSEEQERFKLDELAASDALLLRRVTYEGSAEASDGRRSGVRGHDERLPQARRLDDPPRAPRVEQLDGDQRSQVELEIVREIDTPDPPTSATASAAEHARRTASPVARHPTYGHGRQDDGPSPAEPRHTERRRRT